MSDEIGDDVMGWTCSTYRGGERFIRDFRVGGEAKYLEDQGIISEGLIVKLIVNIIVVS